MELAESVVSRAASVRCGEMETQTKLILTPIALLAYTHVKL